MGKNIQTRNLLNKIISFINYEDTRIEINQLNSTINPCNNLRKSLNLNKSLNIFSVQPKKIFIFPSVQKSLPSHLPHYHLTSLAPTVWSPLTSKSKLVKHITSLRRDQFHSCIISSYLERSNHMWLPSSEIQQTPYVQQ